MLKTSWLTAISDSIFMFYCKTTESKTSDSIIKIGPCWNIMEIKWLLIYSILLSDSIIQWPELRTRRDSYPSHQSRVAFNWDPQNLSNDWANDYEPYLDLSSGGNPIETALITLHICQIPKCTATWNNNLQKQHTSIYVHIYIYIYTPKNPLIIIVMIMIMTLSWSWPWPSSSSSSSSSFPIYIVISGRPPTLNKHTHTQPRQPPKEPKQHYYRLKYSNKDIQHPSTHDKHKSSNPLTTFQPPKRSKKNWLAVNEQLSPWTTS